MNILNCALKHNLWIISDEAYRELAYEKGKETSSIWALTDKDVPGIEGRRISLETLARFGMRADFRIGAIITDNKLCYEKSVCGIYGKS